MGLEIDLSYGAQAKPMDLKRDDKRPDQQKPEQSPKHWLIANAFDVAVLDLPHRGFVGVRGNGRHIGSSLV